MSYAHHKLLTWCLPHLLLLPLTYLWLLALPTGVSANHCRVTGGILGIHWSSIISLGWYPLADGRAGARCWEFCCLEPKCNAVWSLGGRCVFLSCSREGGCPISILPQPHEESLGLLQLLSKVPVSVRRRAIRRAPPTGSHRIHKRPHIRSGSSNTEAAQPTSAAPSTIALIQLSQKNISQITNGSSGTPPAPSPQNSTINVALDAAASSSNDSDVSTPTAASSTINTTPTQAVRELVVSAGKSVEVTLPLNEVKLYAYVVPNGTNYAFDWRLKTHPKDYSGEMEGKHSKTLKLSKLTVGLYEFEVTVDGEGAHGEGYVNVTVKPEPRVNKPPVAVVSPKFQEISLPTSSTVIDGSQSTDDDKVVAWHWEEVKGPLREEKVSADTPVLTLTSLVPGNYTFSLTVTDSDGATNSTQATLSINKAKDYRPVANAGPNQVIQLPRNSITLYGNQSTDDHDSLSYEWSLSPESKDKVVEMQGVRTPILQLSAMQEGDYTFQLTVTDSAGQQDTSQVTVIVQPENNKPPVADAGPEKELTLPMDHTTLYGNKSHDDQKIATYQWTKNSGPDGVKIENADSAVATVTGLKVGTYEFTLTVTDERKLESSDTVTVIVKEEKDQPPVARVVSSPPISLPVRTATLDGSQSTDDKGGLSYLWTREDTSPAAGDVLNSSDHQAVLFLGNLVEGKYSFILTVTDSKGQSSKGRGTVEVKPDVRERDLVELVLEVSVSQVSQRQRDMLLRQVGVLLGVLDSDIIVREISAFNEHSTRLVFLVSGGPGRPPLSGRNVALGLRNKLRKQKNDFLIFKARRVDTVICQLNCSGHGECDSFTRRCVCHPFWMENFIRAQFGDAESNCEWSVLYVTIASFMIVVAAATFVWGIVCCCNRRKSKVRRSKSRYKMLEADDQDCLELQLPRAARLKPVPAPTSSALMHSDSDLDSDEGQGGIPWTDQERGQLLRPQNGSLRNGQGPVRAKKQREERL
ncbi:dyslexia-associated protein KIAA0319-like protein [Simochromis diagramma]|uniref:dyslexia-associated protein KIAA0319-like protein n=1 Tax=Simochromis diagramma TaxID=43689 RepID=UPI001A7E3298|nr:dyslexia-associated protein KIAA0319-like protein [Simochromis diagramma]XP_039876992.1 dyslexia-associated protein KIAA0319-like protein [Simochromis diagramma]XP_039876993.1 dyslexia-associated protein KIAA0319-like protein [Simochromis diagramma]XP_039876994.1 dyslexia-associated protein KIAA0319-like protein [Simochromis diagramma]XP_039876995.1 dyslexia-associated protein KIAA0319-like protein [Simochromis diagramma]XP_039876996.1 dyslexia-associated protein KIAA0319-like protein [Simo